MDFTEKQHDALRAGELVERAFPVKIVDGATKPCPFEVEQQLPARRDGSKGATLTVEVRDVWDAPDGFGNRDWHVVFGMTVKTVGHRLLAPVSGYTGDAKRMLGSHDPEACDAGEAVPVFSDSDFEVRQVYVKREAAVENAVGSVDILGDLENLTREDRRRIRRIKNDLAALSRENRAIEAEEQAA